MPKPHRVITLEINGQPVLVTVEVERSENPGFPDRTVYVTTWDDCRDR